jgi:soluble lytic murein transglycosylase-like protein
MLQSTTMGLSHPSTQAVAETISQESRKYSLDPMLVLAVIKVESEFQSGAVSAYGARGLMQLRPDVAHALAEETDLDVWENENSLHDPVTNIKLGAYYLAQLKEKFGDLKLALTAYNRGPMWVQAKQRSHWIMQERSFRSHAIIANRADNNTCRFEERNRHCRRD